jgi:hypothetical protein
MNGNSLVGIDLSEIKGKYGENVRVISNVVQPISGPYGYFLCYEFFNFLNASVVRWWG